MKFEKHDENKIRPDLIPPEFIEGISDVLAYGARKYDAENWRRASIPDGKRRYYAAAMRHLIAWKRGERLDPESGKPHLYHAACSLAFLSEFDNMEAREQIKDTARRAAQSLLDYAKRFEIDTEHNRAVADLNNVVVWPEVETPKKVKLRISREKAGVWCGSLLSFQPSRKAAQDRAYRWLAQITGQGEDFIRYAFPNVLQHERIGICDYLFAMSVEEL